MLNPKRASFKTEGLTVRTQLSDATCPRTPLSALNPPVAESALARITEPEIERLLEGFDVRVVEGGAGTGGGTRRASAGRSAMLGAVLGMIALGLLAVESFLAWSAAGRRS